MPPTIIDSSRHQARFLAAFGACASILQAARWAKINRQCHYNWLKEDPTYRARFEDATRRAARSLEDEAVRRAYEGLRKAVRYKGKVVGYETEYSDSLLLAILKANAPDKFVERNATTISAPDGGPVALRLEDVRAFMQSTPDAEPK